MNKFHVAQWFLVACWLGLQGAVGPKAESSSPQRSLAPEGKAQADKHLRSIEVLAKAEEQGRLIPLNATLYKSLDQLFFNLQLSEHPTIQGFKPLIYPSRTASLLRPHAPQTPNNLQSSTTFLAKSISCPSEVEALIPLLLRDLPGYATRVMRRTRRPTNTTEKPIYFVLAGRPEFEPLTLGPGQYSTPTLTTDLEPPKQVFFTTLERQYRDGKPTYRQLYHWLFLAKTTEGWRLAMMFSRIGSSVAGRPPTPPEESSEGIVGQAVKIWLRDCRAGAIRESKNGVQGAEGAQRQEE